MRKYLKNISIVLFLFIVSSCSFLSKKETVLIEREQISVTGSVVDISLLREGEGFLIAPFKAGPGVAATGEMDRLSLIIVKSFVDTFESEKTKIRVLKGDQTSQADLVVTGYIVRLDQPRGWVNKLKRKKNFLGIKGKMIDVKTGRVVLDFFGNIDSANTGDMDSLAYDVGADLAEFIISLVEDSE